MNMKIHTSELEAGDIVASRDGHGVLVTDVWHDDDGTWVRWETGQEGYVIPGRCRLVGGRMDRTVALA